MRAKVEGVGRTANDLAFLRDPYDFRNLLMLELPNQDFGRTLLRQFLFDAFQVPWLTALSASPNTHIAAIAAKAVKEATYHLDRSTDTVIALGDGTADSNARMQAALTYLWPYTGEMFADDATDTAVAGAGIAPLPSSIRAPWSQTVHSTLHTACLTPPDTTFAHSGGAHRGAAYRTSGPYVGHHAGAAKVLPWGGLVTDAAQIWQWLDAVPDPEIPVISIVDLGVVRGVSVAEGGGGGDHHPHLFRLPRHGRDCNGH